MTNSIKKANQKIAIREKLFKQMVNFLATDKGKCFLRGIHYYSVPELVRMYQAPNLCKIRQNWQRLELINSAVKETETEHYVRFRITDYTHIYDRNEKTDKQNEAFVEEYRKNKPQIALTAHELKTLNKRDQWSIKRNTDGSPMIRQETVNGKTVNLYDKITGLPLYMYTPKHSGIGVAKRLHMLEMHKMEKYDRKHPIPTEEEAAKHDLFPGQLIEAYKQIREAHIEQIRKDLVDLYCPVSVSVVVKNGDNVKTIKDYAKTKLGRTRSDKVGCDYPLRGDLKNRLATIMDIAKRDNSPGVVTCLHLHTHSHKTGLVVLPERLAIAA